ncbi:hypothetical protein HGG76_19725 [Ochrobactrum tritici]|jgi:hypothetical protein|uniref:Transposase n=1 Tax=Brucella tritici TaxID=94626 RepID=A0A7X6FU22_9HYPH|nr:hypothetical protein [Bacillus sp. PR5]NKW10614.1 hypothetical protein [Brucella tritici]
MIEGGWRASDVPVVISSGLQRHRNGFSKLKALLRKAAEPSVFGSWDRIGQLIEMVEIQEAQNFYISCGYDPI